MRRAIDRPRRLRPRERLSCQGAALGLPSLPESAHTLPALRPGQRRQDREATKHCREEKIVLIRQRRRFGQQALVQQPYGLDRPERWALARSFQDLPEERPGFLHARSREVGVVGVALDMEKVALLIEGRRDRCAQRAGDTTEEREHATGHDHLFLWEGPHGGQVVGGADDPKGRQA